MYMELRRVQVPAPTESPLSRHPWAPASPHAPLGWGQAPPYPRI